MRLAKSEKVGEVSVEMWSQAFFEPPPPPQNWTRVLPLVQLPGVTAAQRLLPKARENAATNAICLQLDVKPTLGARGLQR